MVDKIKYMINEFNPNSVKNIIWKDHLDEEFPNKKLKKGKLYNTSTDNKKIFGLKLLLSENTKTGKFTLSISGSIRKWYFKKNSRKDLAFIEFLECTEMIGNGLGLKKGEIWKVVKITKMEVGLTLLLKSEMRDINNCFVKYRNAERKVRKETSLYFHFTNYSLIFYDKFIEMNENKIWSDIEDNIFKKFHFLRFEIRAEKNSGTNFKGKFDSLERVRNNWNMLPPVIEKYINDVVFVDVISKEKKIEINDYSDFVNYLTFLGIKKNGLLESIDLFNKSINANNKSKKFKEFIDIYRSNVTEDFDFKGQLLLELRKKLSRLYNKSNI